MNVKRYKSFQEFHAEFKEEFTNSANQRLNYWFNTIGTLAQGCGCTRKQRAKICYKEYRKIAHVLKPENVSLMKLKYPNHTFEFSEGDELFWVIPAKGHQFSPQWPKDENGNHVGPS